MILVAGVLGRLLEAVGFRCLRGYLAGVIERATCGTRSTSPTAELRIAAEQATAKGRDRS